MIQWDFESIYFLLFQIEVEAIFALNPNLVPSVNNASASRDIATAKVQLVFFPFNITYFHFH